MKDKIIIDDVDVSKCKFYDSSRHPSRNICEAEQDFCNNCLDCYYKQLQKLKQENQELRDNYINLDLQRIEEYGILLEDYYKMRDLFIKTSEKLIKLQEELDPNIHLAKVDIKLESK